MLPLILAVLTKSDEGLLVRLQQRDPQALAKLYDRYGRVVFGLILRIVQDRGTAEDLVQETFLRVWNRVGGFDSERGAVGPWLLAVARNRAIDYLRYRGRRPESSLELSETENPTLFADVQADPIRCGSTWSGRSSRRWKNSPGSSVKPSNWPISRACRRPRLRKGCGSRWAP